MNPEYYYYNYKKPHSMRTLSITISIIINHIAQEPSLLL